MHSWLAPHLVLPLFERASGRRPWTEAQRLRALQWRSADELQSRSLVRLQALLAHAAAHVPYYRERFAEAGSQPAKLHTLADLARLPITTRADLRAGFPLRTLADNLPPGRRQPMLTSGSSGFPLEFYADRTATDIWLGSYFFFLGWLHTGIWDTVVTIGSPTHLESNVARPSGLVRWARRLALGERTVRLSGLELTPAELRATLQRQVGGRSYFIRGYASYLAQLARQLLQSGLELPRYPKAVLNHAETLTPANAATIQQAFRCPVVDQYSAWEVPQMAQTCPDNPSLLHVNSERAMVRVVRDDGTDCAPGEAGRIVITDLANWVMPFINYDIGDRAIAGAGCPCGRGFPTISSLDGRVGETIRTPTGRVISPGSLSHTLFFGSRVLPYVWEYQAVQTGPAAVKLLVVPTERFDQGFARKLVTDLEALFGPGVTLAVETVDHIPLERSGKRLIIRKQLDETATHLNPISAPLPIP
jgi:phenylacetate-CoA ligase